MEADEATVEEARAAASETAQARAAREAREAQEAEEERRETELFGELTDSPGQHAPTEREAAALCMLRHGDSNHAPAPVPAPAASSSQRALLPARTCMQVSVLNFASPVLPLEGRWA